MFNSTRAGARRLTGHRQYFSITYLLGLGFCLCFCVVLWAAAHYEFGFYLDRAHSKGSRIYRVNSYEQFIRKRTVEWTMGMAA